MNRPLFSVIDPTCQRNDLLANCLQTLVPPALTLPGNAFEIVVTGDGRRSTAQGLIQSIDEICVTFDFLIHESCIFLSTK